MSHFSPRLTRRQLLAAGAAAALSSRSLRRSFAAEAASPTADMLIPGKDRRLVVHKDEPFEIETPLGLLNTDGLTSVETLFVRNNFQPAWSKTLQPADPAMPWSLEFAGLVEYPRTLTLADLADLPRVEHEMVLQCSGNGRALFAKVKPIKGSQWSRGAVGDVRFRGVALRAVLEKFGIHPHASARFLTAEGIDAPTKPGEADFEHSLPLADALDRSLLALELNGRPLPAVHGGPLRLVTPGYYGTMHVKWLSRLRFEAQESVNHHQVKRYRTPLRPLEPGADFDYGLDNSEPNWGMRIKSIVLSPTDGAALPAGPTTVRGVAWNDGLARIDAVEWSLDDGRNWHKAELQLPTSTYAWCPFEARLELAAGSHTILCRAVDTLGRTQPRNGLVGWNPAGYGWNGVETIRVAVQ